MRQHWCICAETGQLLHLADLSHVLRHGLGRDAERLGVGQFVEVVTGARIEVTERLQLPFLACEPGECAALDVR